ncbi:hypothetical protein THAR02_03483 [Trichoderma harzianum]|uniref:Uncharacterized protein n=1 Tax=Trichoderma harzianum TaxID=5544 RepID=A0A0F9ZWK7_TRIHA|nr:hypothetical protein THAR02_03483 [Trichoderma harzianum]
MANNVVVAGDPAKTPPVVPGQTTPRNEGTTPSVPSKGQTTVLALTPKKKSKRLRTGEYAVESMPVLNLGTAKAPSIPKKSSGIDSSIFSGNRERKSWGPRKTLLPWAPTALEPNRLAEGTTNGPTAAAPDDQGDNDPAEVTWARIASKEKTHKNKANNANTSESNGKGPAPSSGPRGKNKAAKAEQKPDDRIFIRVPPDHVWKKMSAIGARQELVSKAKLQPDDITDFREVRSGFALRPKNQEIKKRILATGAAVTDKNLKFEEACTWETYLVRRVEKFYKDATGHNPTDALIPEEARVAAGASRPPVACRKAPFGETPDTCCYYISFDEKVKNGFRLFSTSAPAEPRLKKIRGLGRAEYEKLNPPPRPTEKPQQAPTSTPTPAPSTAPAPVRRIRGLLPGEVRNPIFYPNYFVIDVDEDEDGTRNQDKREPSPARLTIEAVGDENGDEDGDENIDDAGYTAEEAPESPL